eukprot:15432916-Alexandrium_andersonii.AAC.1
MGHDQKPFQDEHRANQRGFDLADGRCGALCEMRADLLEFVTACGFKTWSHVKCPCFCCTCVRDSLFDFPARVESSKWAKGTSPSTMPRRTPRFCNA